MELEVVTPGQFSYLYRRDSMYTGSDVTSAIVLNMLRASHSVCIL